METERGASPKNQVISLTSGKGGVGKSTLCVGLGLGFALCGQSSLLIEFDSGLRGIDLMLGIADQIVFDLGDLLEGRCTISKAVLPSPLNDNLSAIVAPLSLEAPLNLENVQLLIGGLRPHFDRIILDMPAGLGTSARVTSAAADLALIVATPDRICVRDGCRMAQELQRAGFENHRLVINRVNEQLIRKDIITDLDEVIDGVGSQLIGVLPDDPDIQLRLSRGLALGERHRITRICKAIACRISGEYIPLLLR